MELKTRLACFQQRADPRDGLHRQYNAAGSIQGSKILKEESTMPWWGEVDLGASGHWQELHRNSEQFNYNFFHLVFNLTSSAQNFAL